MLVFDKVKSGNMVKIWKLNYAKRHLVASKALYGVFRKIRYFKLPIDCQLDLFDKVINPILLYSCEVWGYENINIIEKVHLKFSQNLS